MIYKRFSVGDFGATFSNWRSHHSDMILGAWRTAINARQFFIGRFSVTFTWPNRLSILQAIFRAEKKTA